MPKRTNYYYDEEMASGYPDHGRPNKFRHLSLLGGAAAVGTQYAYSKIPTKEDVLRAAASSPKAMWAVYNAMRLANSRLARETDSWGPVVERARKRAALPVQVEPSEDPGFVDEAEYRVLYGNKNAGFGSAQASSSSVKLPKVLPLPRHKFSKRFSKAGAVVKTKPLRPELDHPVKVELPDGQPSYVRPMTYSHDADDLVDQDVSDVKLGSSSVLNHSLYNVSILGDRTICNDDGEGAAMVRANNGRFFWQVGALRYPVQYSGKSVVPFSISNARYQFVVPLVDVG